MSFIKSISIDDILYEININGIMKLNLNGIEYNLGLDTSNATAFESDIFQWKTAYVNGKRIIGTKLCRDWVGTNNCLAISNSEKLVAISIGDRYQVNKSPTNNKTYASIRVPNGSYNGESYVGVEVNEINLLSSNIKDGITIFGSVYGTFTQDGNITTTDEIIQGQIAYSKGKKYTGTLPDRNTVGRNSAIGINQNYPLVALNKGSFQQYTMALDGKEYFCICVPKGYYNGNSYVGILKSEIPN